MIDPKVTAKLVEGFANFGWGHLVMILVGGILIYLAIVKEYEPVLLLPIGIGCIMANIPVTGMTEVEGLFGVLYAMGIKNELFPLLIFIGIGAMTDFGPLLERPYTVILGAAAQFGIFGTLLMATLLGFDINQAASIGIIGSADGPTSIYVASTLAPPTDRPPSTWPPSWRPTCSHRSPWRRIRTCPWSPSSSRPSCGRSPRRQSEPS